MVHKLYETPQKKNQKTKKEQEQEQPHHPKFTKCPKHLKTWAFGEGSNSVLSVSFFVFLYNVIFFFFFSFLLYKNLTKQLRFTG